VLLDPPLEQDISAAHWQKIQKVLGLILHGAKDFYDDYDFSGLQKQVCVPLRTPGTRPDDCYISRHWLD
jgi:hypothetical protein